MIIIIKQKSNFLNQNIIIYQIHIRQILFIYIGISRVPDGFFLNRQYLEN